MAHEITVPRLGWSMEQGRFVRWLKQDGDEVRAGEPLFELEGEKASQEIEALDSGILRLVPDSPQPGATVSVGAVLGYLAMVGESLPSATIRSIPVEESIERVVEHVLQDSIAPKGRVPGPELTSSPRARRIAAELGVNWKQLKGNGRTGRIRERDVRTAAADHSTATTGTDVATNSRRQTIAKRLRISHERTVPVTLTSQADATSIVRLREQFKADGKPPTPSYTDMIAKLVAAALSRHPYMAARWQDDRLVPATEFHLGIAVDTEEGLLVPVVRKVESLLLTELASRSSELIGRARAGQLAAADMQGAVFTITNLGAYGIDAFTPVINYPETAILGVGAIRPVAVCYEGQCVGRDMISLSLTFDHLAMDGAPAARFLQTLCQMIESAEATTFDHQTKV